MHPRCHDCPGDRAAELSAPRAAPEAHRHIRRLLLHQAAESLFCYQDRLGAVISLCMQAEGLFPYCHGFVLPYSFARISWYRMNFYELYHIRAAFVMENISNLSMDFFPLFCYDNNHFFP
jgi:hypothetical protein